MLEEEDRRTYGRLGEAGGAAGGSGGKRHLINALLLSFSFFLIFFAYSTTQNLESSLLPGKLGYWSLAALYASFCVSSLFIAAPIANLLPPRFALLVGGAAYIPLTAANLYPQWGTMIPAAVVLGCGAGILWTAQGSYLTAAASNYARANNKESKATMGMFTGIFFSIFQMTQVTGNLIAGFIFMYGGEDQSQARDILFYIFLGVAVIGVGLFLALGKEVTEKERRSAADLEGSTLLADRNVNSDPVPRRSIGSRLFGRTFDVLRLLGDPRMLLMVPVCIYSGMEQSFVPGDFNADIVKQAKGVEWIGFVMAVYGAFDATASVLLGRMADVVGKRLYLIVGFAAHASFIGVYLAIVNISNIETLKDDFWILFLTAAVLGVADACWNTFPPLMMSVFFADAPEPAFGNLKFWQSIGAICPFVWGPLISFQVKLIILGSVLTLSVASVMFLDLKVASISDTSDSKERKDEFHH